jgi:uncharacterized membrane protein
MIVSRIFSISTAAFTLNPALTKVLVHVGPEEELATKRIAGDHRRTTIAIGLARHCGGALIW